MRLRRMLALFAVLALIAVACGDSDGGTTTTGDDVTQTTATPTTVVDTTVAETTTTEDTGDTTTTSEAEMMDLAFDVGFDEETGTIKLGVLAATTGPIADIGQSLLAGHQHYWDRVNEGGGVAGMYPVELVIRDNAYNPEQNVVVYNEIKDEVLAFSSTIGTPTTATIFEDAADNDLLVAAGSLASQWALTENVVLNLGANTYFAQFANAPYWAVEIADPPVITTDSVIGIIYQADDYGADCKAGYDFGLENMGLTSAYEDTYAVGDSDFSGQIGGAQAAGVDVLFICALPSVLAPMVGTMAALTYFPAIFGSSPSYIPILNGALGGGDAAAGAALFNQFPYYNLGTSAAWEDDFPGMEQMRADFEASGAPIEAVTAFYFFGYTQGQTFNEILEAAIANGDITKQGMLAAVDQVQGVDLGLGGSPAGYGPTPKDRLSTNEDAIGLVVTTDDAVFGLDRISDFFEAPYLADWDPAS